VLAEKPSIIPTAKWTADSTLKDRRHSESLNADYVTDLHGVNLTFFCTLEMIELCYLRYHFRIQSAVWIRDTGLLRFLCYSNRQQRKCVETPRPSAQQLCVSSSKGHDWTNELYIVNSSLPQKVLSFYGTDVSLPCSKQPATGPQF
jgi:hypothetical protein